MAGLTADERKLLENYVTSCDKNVFAVKNMNGLAGAVFARYSRARGGFRETLLKEFLKDGNIDPVHADGLIERVLIAYGDDSVGELEGAHVSFEKITMLAAKEIEDRRIGGSPIEQSTRYVAYDMKDENGNWPYYRGKEILDSNFGAEYCRVMDQLFSFYASLVEPLKQYLQGKKKITDAEYDINGDGKNEQLAELSDPKQIKAFEQTYNFELRAKACDLLRGLLPLSTLTNVGIFGNGRFYQHMMSGLLTSDIPEFHQIAGGVKDSLATIMPQYVRRAQRQAYAVEVRAEMQALADELIGRVEVKDTTDPAYVLVDRGEALIESMIRGGASAREALQEASDVQMIAQMLYPYTNSSLVELKRRVGALAPRHRQRVVAAYVGNRKTRRDRPGRALEDGYTYTFDVMTDFAVYKDLQRHRMVSQQRQVFGMDLGVYIPEELEAVASRADIERMVGAVRALWERMAGWNRELAQYLVLAGNYIRWTISMNDREAVHLLELRSGLQGHPRYREAAQQMHKAIKERCGWRGEMMGFVDHRPHYWSRAESEARQRVKESQLEQKLAGNG